MTTSLVNQTDQRIVPYLDFFHRRVNQLKQHCQDCPFLKRRKIDFGFHTDYKCGKTKTWFCINEPDHTFKEWKQYAFDECEKEK